MSNTKPTASIAVKRNKVKAYPGNQVFLKNGQEFEIELFNPTDTTQLAKISMNGKAISTSGIVLKPGQRVYLERYLDKAQKFKFSTYEVDGSDEEVQKAIAKNGDITISFYNEKPAKEFDWSYTSQPLFQETSFNSMYNAQRSLSDDGPKFRTSSLKSKGYGASAGGQSVNSASRVSYMSSPEPQETGRIEAGDKSSQGFSTYNGEFEWWAHTTVSIKLLPESLKPVEVTDLATYCTECGTKNKKGTYKFCPTCGTKY